MASVFDGMADIFVSTFGEGEQAVIYTPIAGGDPIPLNAIWWEQTTAVDSGDGVFEDVKRTELHLRAVDVPDPQEGDTATRVSDGKVMQITTPIRADGKGMIMCNLAAIDDDVITPPAAFALNFSDAANGGYLALLEDI